MNGKRKIISFVFGVCLSIIIGGLLMLTILIPINTKIASAITAEVSTEDLCKLYTDSDTVYGMQKTIREYPSDLIASNTTFVNPINFNKLNIVGDDPIINIIPKAYFTEIGDHFYIGKEYGFFVNTKECDPQTNNRLSTVLVFDITTNNNFEQTMDRLMVRIEPIFQYYFVYISNTTPSFNVPETEHRYVCEGVSTTGNIVAVPTPSYPSLGNLYEQCEEYYLKDVSFGASLFNEQELNPHNRAYQAEQDDGSFIIVHDYVYNGVKRTSQGIDPSSVEGVSMVLSGIGTCLGVIGMFNPAIGILGSVISVTGFASSIYDAKNQANPAPYLATVTNGRFTATCNYSTRREQLAHYVDAETRKPALTKAATIVVEGDDNVGNLWYNVGGFAEGYFTLADSAQTTPWYTRYIQEIALSVVDKEGVEHIKNGFGSQTYMLYEPIYKEIKVDKLQQVSFLPEGNNYFEFAPQYTSEYELNFDSDLGYSIYAQDVTTNNAFLISPVNGIYKYTFEGGHQYKLRVFSPLGDVVNLNFEPADSQTAHSIASNSTYLYKYTSVANQLVTVSSSQTDAQIAKIYIKGENGNFNELQEFATFKQGISTEMYMQQGQTYYFVLNNTGAMALNAKVNVNNLDRQLSEYDNAPLTLASNDNFKYYKFVPTTTCDYYITFDNSVNEDYIITYYCFDENKQRSFSTSEYNDGYLVLNNLIANKPYYIGISSSFTMSVTPKLTKTLPQFVWKYAENGIWKTITNRNLYLTRGKNYDFAMWINGVKAKNYDIIISGADASNFSKIPNEECGVAISSMALDNSHINIQAKFEGKNGLNYDNYITVYALFDESQFTFKDTNYNNTTIVNVFCPMGVISWNATILGQNYTSNSTSCNVFDKLVEKQSTGVVAFKVTSIVIRSASESGERTIQVDKTTYVNATYSRSEVIQGKAFYHIGNELQFYNIRNEQRYARILDNDISLNKFSFWTPFSQLSCDINGNGKKIKNLKIQVEGGAYATPRYGLIDTNYVTISNLTLEFYAMSLGWEDTPSTWTYAGAFAGINRGTIQNCYAYGSVMGYRDLQSVGGIAGVNYGNILNSEYGSFSKSRSKVYGWGDVGGIAGQNFGKIQDCRTLNTDVEQRLYGTSRSIGGIVGYGGQGNSIIRCTVENASIKNVNDSTIKSLYPKMGVIVGHDYCGTITSVGMNNVITSTGTLYKNNKVYCFNGPWPFFGWMENCTVDGNPGQNAP